MDDNRVPDEVAAAIEECWPDGVIAEFDTEESYFYGIYGALERDLRKIPGATLIWQTEAEREDWQSYHVFFLAPQGGEFEFETETEVEDPEDPNGGTVTYPGRGWYGCGVFVSFASPLASVRFSDYSQFDDGSVSTPDPGEVAHYEDTGEPVDLATSYRQDLGGYAFAKLESLSSSIVTVLAKHDVTVLDQAILDLPAPGLEADSETIDEPLSVRDAFFFRGA
jgi:catechol 2,3-dioxygenase-like lactoylglutathione lyase family enzyme